MSYKSPVITTESPCEEPADQTYGHRTVNCLEPFVYKGQCQFECDDGYELVDGSVSLVTCIAQIVEGAIALVWDNSPAACEGMTNLTTRN